MMNTSDDEQLISDDFIVEQLDSGKIVMKHKNYVWNVGTKIVKARRLASALSWTHRPSIEQRNDIELWVCWNEHEKGDKCDWVQEI